MRPAEDGEENDDQDYPPRCGQKGFTLIEIVMVLVLLGILAAVAVPKYFDLQEEAEEKALDAVAAEVNARYNGYFAQFILEGRACNQDVLHTALVLALSGVQYELADKIQIEADGDAWNETQAEVTMTILPKGASKTYTTKFSQCGQ